MLYNIEDAFILSRNQLKLIKNQSSSLKINIDYLNRFIGIELNDLEEIKEYLGKYLVIAKEYRKSISQDKELESIKD